LRNSNGAVPLCGGERTTVGFDSNADALVSTSGIAPNFRAVRGGESLDSLGNVP
jgi:hypothetical protein